MRTLMPPMIETMKSMRTMQLTMQSTQAGMYDQLAAQQENQSAMGKPSTRPRTTTRSILPPEAFDNPDFQRGMKMFLSPDGKAVRFIISHEGDPMSPEGLSHVDPIKNAAFEAIKGTPLEGSKIYLAGTAASYKDMQDSANYDLLIAGIAALCLIFIIMLIITRAVSPPRRIVGTVLLSLGTSFGLSVLVWQDLIGRPLHWMVLVMSVIILLAVGSDYNLLLVARLKEEVGAGSTPRHHPRDGRQRFGGHLGGSGVRGDDGGDGVQRADHPRPGRHHDRHGSAGGHPGDPLVHDTVDRRAVGPLVLVAAAGSPASGALAVAAAENRFGTTCFGRLLGVARGPTTSWRCGAVDTAVFELPALLALRLRQ